MSNPDDPRRIAACRIAAANNQVSVRGRSVPGGRTNMGTGYLDDRTENPTHGA
jgi:hypothetical protein